MRMEHNSPITHESRRHLLISVAVPSLVMLDAQCTSLDSLGFKLVHS